MSVAVATKPMSEELEFQPNNDKNIKDYEIDEPVMVLSHNDIGLIVSVGKKTCHVRICGKVIEMNRSNIKSVNDHISSKNAGERQGNFAVDQEYQNDYLQDKYEPEQYRVLNTILTQVREGFDKFLLTYSDYSYLRSIDVDKVTIGDKIGMIDRSGSGRILNTDVKIFKVSFGNETIEADESSIKSTTLIAIEDCRIEDVKIPKGDYTIKRDKLGYILADGKIQIRLSIQQFNKAEKTLVNRKNVGDQVKVVNQKGTGKINDVDVGVYKIDFNGDIVTAKRTQIKPIDEYINKLKITDISLLYTFIRSNMKDNLFGEIEYFYIFSEYFKINEKTLYSSLPIKIQSTLLSALKNKLGPGIFKKNGNAKPMW